MKGDDETLFTGEAWTGNKALELGLVDGIDNLGNCFFFYPVASFDLSIQYLTITYILYNI